MKFVKWDKEELLKDIEIAKRDGRVLVVAILQKRRGRIEQTTYTGDMLDTLKELVLTKYDDNLNSEYVEIAAFYVR